MAKSWLVDARAIAQKVKSSSLPLVHQIKDSGATRDCPRCHNRIDNSDDSGATRDCPRCHNRIDNSNVSVEWPGLPRGVKFEPSDVEILEHLAAKCGTGNEKSHQFIDEFIPTLDNLDGICYKHPENLPGARRDGSSVHFFYRTTKAYTIGQRKRRKICKDSNMTEDVRWHKTGKTRGVIQNGVQIGCKKIHVLYGSAGGGSKPYKLDWVMHQYHLGTVEDEKEGQYFVAKIFYQQQKGSEKVDDKVIIDDLDAWMRLTSPKTPMTDAPDPRRPGKSVSYEDITPAQDSRWSVEHKYLPSTSNGESKDNMELPIWEDDSQAVDLAAFDDSLFCNENLDIYAPLGDTRLNHGSNVNTGAPETSRGASSKVADLNELDLGTPPDFNLTDLQFSSQDSIFGWLERL